MVTSEQIAMLREQKHVYLRGLQRGRREDTCKFITKAIGPWQENVHTGEVAGNEPAVRVFVVQSDE